MVIGDRLRVTPLVPTRPVYGAFVSADSVGLLFTPGDGGGVSVRTPLAELRRIEVSRGARSRLDAFRRGAGIGFLVGAGIGTVATGLALREDRRSSCDCIISSTAIVGALSLAFTGVTTLVGGGIGISTRERWRQVLPPR